MVTSPGATISTQCFTDVSADETLGPWIDVRGRAYVVFYLTSAGVTSSGVVTIEEAAPKDFSSSTTPPVFGAGTAGYSVVTTKNAADFTGGLQVAVHLTPAAYCFVRARISTTIGGGGTISANCIAY